MAILHHIRVFARSFCTTRYFSTQINLEDIGEELLVNDTEIESKALGRITEDLSHINTYLPQSFNLAAYVNRSDLLQNLLHLNVDLSKIERKPYIAEKMLKLDVAQFEKQIMFLKDFVDSDTIGKVITRNPLILFEPLEDLEVRVNYMQSKRFSDLQIKRIISTNPFWLMYSTLRIDGRLGFFQGNFILNGEEVRYLSTKQPKLITYNLHHVKTNSFVIKEEMGFEDSEMKQLILHKPRLLMINQKALLQRFNYLHNEMKLPHEVIKQCPNVLLSRNFRLKQRHLFLDKLGRAQYNPVKENFVPLIALIENTDIEFCKTYAKCNVNDFNTFLKTL